MKKSLNEYFFTITYATILIIFAFPITDLFTKSLWFYCLLFVVIVGSTFFIERTLNKKYSLQEKAKKLCYSLVPINIIVIIIFYVFIL